jgi:hypothetical protein
MAGEPGREKSHATCDEASPSAPAAGCGAALRGRRAERNGPPLKGLSLCRGKGFETGLARQRIFHIGNAMKTATVP